MRSRFVHRHESIAEVAIEGFVLAGCCGDKRGFRTTECGFEEILLKACKACLLVTVYLEQRREECIRRLVVHC